ncbi:Uncharacterized protein PHPALM_6595 [Phytophthora palmivora]|uniref:RxLR effector n=1 Tax=Phytophthora palmivora TaxID=4796 RepID=A0A2P4YEE9_9STRA|nr:Uncharacterized protein PHPALM_6595 [Phytophthora palmivora]
MLRMPPRTLPFMVLITFIGWWIMVVAADNQIQIENSTMNYKHESVNLRRHLKGNSHVKKASDNSTTEERAAFFMGKWLLSRKNPFSAKNIEAVEKNPKLLKALSKNVVALEKNPQLLKKNIETIEKNPQLLKALSNNVEAVQKNPKLLIQLSKNVEVLEKNPQLLKENIEIVKQNPQVLKMLSNKIQPSMTKTKKSTNADEDGWIDELDPHQKAFAIFFVSAPIICFSLMFIGIQFEE